MTTVTTQATIPKYKTPSDFIGTHVEVRSPEEYIITRALYLSLGAAIWSWHKGYTVLSDEDLEYPGYKLYGWEECGFLGHSGMSNHVSGTFASVDALIHAIQVMNKARPIEEPSPSKLTQNISTTHTAPEVDDALSGRQVSKETSWEY